MSPLERDDCQYQRAVFILNRSIISDIGPTCCEAFNSNCFLNQIDIKLNTNACTRVRGVERYEELQFTSEFIRCAGKRHHSHP